MLPLDSSDQAMLAAKSFGSDWFQAFHPAEINERSCAHDPTVILWMPGAAFMAEIVGDSHMNCFTNPNYTLEDESYLLEVAAKLLWQ